MSAFEPETATPHTESVEIVLDHHVTESMGNSDGIDPSDSDRIRSRDVNQSLQPF
jgi:hypothetical protein